MAIKDVQIGHVGPAEDNPFARAHDVPADHPVAKAFDYSWDNGSAVMEVETDEPAEVEKIVRKYAKQVGLGVRCITTETGLAFSARKRRRRGASAAADDSE